eukprot:CAMPEP_0182514136 /NCGR_PEP_ID=MMETSP1321-20130603/35203_1 /TAXON_ID=91990 /ORGANISM="Bolidomonas sp., Strain RCC1657" /LENGTH=227 /DNA_ID=CAMNT_0024721261 /DNA_START=64 /DNA_END=743 /DNA_ORIENTATION=-
MVRGMALFLLPLLLLPASAHPPAFVDFPMSDPKVAAAIGNYTEIISGHLSPFQSIEVEMVLSAQRQQVSGTNYIFAACVRDDMIFDTERKRHGWPSHQLQFFRVYEDWIGHTPSLYTVQSNEIVPKQMYIDPLESEHTWLHSHAESCVSHLNSHLLLPLLPTTFSSYEQELVEYLRADVQSLPIENYAMNLTRLPDVTVRLVDVIFLTKCKNCGSGQEYISVGVVAV